MAASKQAPERDSVAPLPYGPFNVGRGDGSEVEYVLVVSDRGRGKREGVKSETTILVGKGAIGPELGPLLSLLFVAKRGNKAQEKGPTKSLGTSHKAFIYPQRRQRLWKKVFTGDFPAVAPERGRTSAKATTTTTT